MHRLTCLQIELKSARADHVADVVRSRRAADESAAAAGDARAATALLRRRLAAEAAEADALRAAGVAEAAAAGHQINALRADLQGEKARAATVEAGRRAEVGVLRTALAAAVDPLAAEWGAAAKLAAVCAGSKYLISPGAQYPRATHARDGATGRPTTTSTPLQAAWGGTGSPPRPRPASPSSRAAPPTSPTTISPFIPAALAARLLRLDAGIALTAELRAAEGRAADAAADTAAARANAADGWAAAHAARRAAAVHAANANAASMRATAAAAGEASARVEAEGERSARVAEGEAAAAALAAARTKRAATIKRLRAEVTRYQRNVEAVHAAASEVARGRREVGGWLLGALRSARDEVVASKKVGGSAEASVPDANAPLDWDALSPADRERVLGLAFMRLRARR